MAETEFTNEKLGDTLLEATEEFKAWLAHPCTRTLVEYALLNRDAATGDAIHGAPAARAAYIAHEGVANGSMFQFAHNYRLAALRRRFEEQRIMAHGQVAAQGWKDPGAGVARSGSPQGGDDGATIYGVGPRVADSRNRVPGQPLERPRDRPGPGRERD